MKESEQRANAAEGQEKAATGDERNSAIDRLWEFLARREHELRAVGMPEGRAYRTAILERRIAEMPQNWGSELRIIIYGDFDAPDSEIHFSDLGIVIEPGAVKDSIVRSAMCVLNARVTISERSVAAVLDAAARIDTLLGAWAAVDLGNPRGWWCRVTHMRMGRVMQPFDQHAIQKVIKNIQNCPSNVRRKVTSALHWIREPRQMLMEYRSDVLQVYAGYWNAFECLVDVVCLLHPPPKHSKTEKQAEIDKFLADHAGKLDAASIRECYLSVVDPGFVAKASHALRQCFPERAHQYIVECFKAKPEEDRLYNIRNAINHGDIEPENLQELIRVEDKHMSLWMIVFGMLGQIIPIPRPLDRKPS